jgi:CRP-like cAMP-binding protein
MDVRIVQQITTSYHAPLCNEALNAFASILERREYKKNEIVLNQGHINHFFYYVESGMIRQFYYKKGRDITEHFSYEGHTAVCIESLYRHQPTNLLIETLEPAILHLIPFSKWEKLCIE